jgi:hypothetical protein
MRRLLTTWLGALGLVLGLAAPSAAQEACESSSRALWTGPLQVALLDGQLGLGRSACPRTEIRLGGDLALVAEVADFYGNVKVDAALGGSWAITEGTEVFAGFEAFRFQTVISSIAATFLGTGYFSLGATQRIWSGSGVSLAFTGRLVLPTSTLDQNSNPLALDVGLNLAWAGHRVVQLFASMLFAGSLGMSEGPALPRGGARFLVGLDIHPLRWLAIVVQLEAGFGYRGAVDLIAPGAGFRFAIGRHFGIELGAVFPVAGEERALAAGALQLSWRFDAPRERPAEPAPSSEPQPPPPEPAPPPEAPPPPPEPAAPSEPQPPPPEPAAPPDLAPEPPPPPSADQGDDGLPETAPPSP